MIRNSCKLILVLLCCAVPLAAVLVSGQQNNATSDRHYPRTDRTAINQPSAASRQPQNDAEAADADEQLANDEKAAEATRKAAPTRAIAGLGAEDGPGPSFHPLAARERGWIVAAAALGLMSSLAAAGYLAWSRSRPARAPVAVLLPRRGPQLSDSATGVPPANQSPKRRAA